MATTTIKILTLALLCCVFLAASAFSVTYSIQKESLSLRQTNHSPVSLHVRPYSCHSTSIMSSLDDDDEIETIGYDPVIETVVSDPVFNGKTTIALVGGQSLLVVIAIVAAKVLVS